MEWIKVLGEREGEGKGGGGCTIFGRVCSVSVYLWVGAYILGNKTE